NARHSPGRRPRRTAGRANRRAKVSPARRRAAPPRLRGGPDRRESVPRATGLLEKTPLLVLALLTEVEARNRTVIPHDAGPDFAGLPFGVREHDNGSGGD